MQLDASGVRLDRVSGEGRRLGILLALAAVIALSVPVQAAEPIPDRKITWAVEGALREDPAVSAHLVDVETAEGIVTLEGRVNHLLAKERAEEVAALVKGVRGIVNRIDVTPEPRSDSSIRLDVNDALLWDPAVEAAQIDVEVDRAVVTLEGAVDSWAERTLAADVTKGVIGVREVHNELTVQQSGDRSDEEIAEEVRRRLTNDAGVDAALIDVSVNDGEVTLSGAVGSVAELRQAQRDARVNGVRDVDTDELEVRWWARERMREVDSERMQDPVYVRQAILDAWLYDPRVSAFELDVFVEDGVATLIGVVDNLKASRAAANDARSVDGIWKVENHIRVRPDTERSDPALERRIEDALQLDPYLDAIEVQPTVVSGKVYLDGEVRTPFEKRHATDVVSHVAGVVEIENRLRVSDEWQWQPDFAIQRDVEQELFWNPFVDASQIHVSVEHGVVTLSGRVESWREYSLATGNAFEAGAKDVRNQLKVDYAPWFGGAG